jgi:hypothetical protein
MKLAPRQSAASKAFGSSEKSRASRSITSISDSRPASAIRFRATWTNTGARSTPTIRQPNASARTIAGPPFPHATSTRRLCESRRRSSPTRRIFSGLVGFWMKWSCSAVAKNQGTRTRS